ncbi:response regulator [Xanthobacter agilis]|uniref:response regulator n=1 Tax=Xanthobacter agilis TaxID=47492 RepID=UPI00372BC5B5
MADIIKAVAELLWPVIALIAIWMIRPLLLNLRNSKHIKVKVGDYELTLGDATAGIGSNVTDIQAKIAELSERLERFPNHIPIKADKTYLPDSSNSAPQRLDGQKPQKRKKILWVDDYPSNNAFLVERLRSSGYHVDISTTTTNAIDKISSDNYAMLITDLGRMEDGENHPMAGRDLIAAIRVTYPTMPCLIFSSARAMNMVDQLLAAGATDVTSSGTDVLQFVETHAAGR